VFKKEKLGLTNLISGFRVSTFDARVLGFGIDHLLVRGLGSKVYDSEPRGAALRIPDSVFRVYDFKPHFLAPNFDYFLASMRIVSVSRSRVNLGILIMFVR